MFGHLEYILQKFQDNKFYVKWTKSEFLKLEINFLRHVLFHEHMKFELKKAQAIKEWQNLAIVSSFFRLVNFYKNFIKDFLALAKPIIDLLKELSFD